MLVEIVHAVDFLCRLIAGKVDLDTLMAFKQSLTQVLSDRFQNHWDIHRPYVGNGYRAVSRFNEVMDPVLLKAAQMSSLSLLVLYTHIPREFVIWIDPFSVSYRVGDHGNIMTLFEDRSRGRVTLKMDANSPVMNSVYQFVNVNSPSLGPAILRGPRSTPIRITPPPSPPSKKGQNQLVMAN